MAATKVRLLGELRVEVNGAHISVRGEILRSLVALLALSARRPVSAEVLIERLWAEQLPANPRAALHSALARLRRVLGDDTVTTHPEAYELVVEPRHVDAVLMNDLFAAAEREPDTSRKLELYDQGIALWGEPFDSGFVDWLGLIEKARLTENYLTAVERWADVCLNLGLNDRLCARVRSIAPHHPLRESLWSRYLLGLTASGRRAEATVQYERVSTALFDELGVEPGEELRGAYSATTAGSQRTEMIPWRQLPPDVSRFVGRKETLAEMDRLLLRPGLTPGANCAVVLHGEAGIGKTSLAVHWAHQTATDPYAAGEQLFVDLAGYAGSGPVDAGDALDELLRSMGVAGSSIPASLAGRSALFRSLTAGRRLVMILDDARSAEQVRPLLPGGSSVVIITSRSRLDGLGVRDGVHQIAVPPLRPEEAHDLLTAALRKPAATPQLDRLAGLCSGLPLALAVVSARINRDPHPDVAELVDRLDRSGAPLDALTMMDDPASDLRIVLDGSYRALDPDPARLFRGSGVVGHPLCVDAAATVTSLDPETAGRGFHRLADLHLITESVPGRFEQHALLSSFAREKARDHDGPEGFARIESRLLDWYLHSVLAATSAMGVPVGIQYAAEPPPGCHIKRFRSSAEAMAWYDAERRHLVGAVVDGARRGHHRAAARLAISLWHYLEQRWDFTDSMRVQRTALSAAQEAGDLLLEALAGNQLGVSSGRSGHGQVACDLLRRALELFQKLDHDEGQSLASDNLGLALRLVGDYRESLRYLEASLTGARRRGDEVRVARCLNNLALTQLALHRADEATESGAEAVRLHAAACDWRGLAYAYDTLGLIQLRQNEYASAIASLQAAVRLASEHQLTSTGLLARINLGRAHAGAGDTTAARSVWSETLARYDGLPVDDRGPQLRLGQELRGLLADLGPGSTS